MVCGPPSGHGGIGLADLAMDELREAVEVMLRCRAIFSKSVPVSEELSGHGAWDGVVHTFDLVGHPGRSVAYAWLAVLTGGAPRPVVLTQGKLIASPVRAVRFVLMARQPRSPA